MSNFVCKKYLDFVDRKHKIPKYFDVYNGAEVKDYMITLGTHCGTPAGIGNVLIFLIKKEYDNDTVSD